jgi:hypothetical protein
MIISITIIIRIRIVSNIRIIIYIIYLWEYLWMNNNTGGDSYLNRQY